MNMFRHAVFCMQPATLRGLGLIALSCGTAWAAGPQAPDARNAGDCQAVRIPIEFPRVYDDGKIAVYAQQTVSNVGGTGTDVVLLEFHGDGYGSVGTFDLGEAANSNYSTCEQCALLSQDVDPETGAGEKTFFQSAGFIVIAPSGPGSDPIAVDMPMTRVVEVTIDPSSFVSTPVVGGDCYDLIQVGEIIFASGFE